MRGKRSPRALARNVFGLLGFVALAGIAVVPTSAAAAASATTHWKLSAGAQSPNAAIQANAFLPHDLSVRVGDTVTWTVPTGEFHTVTFLSGEPQPPFIAVGPNGPNINPVAAAPAGGGTYRGTGYFNSGLLFQGQSYTLGFGKTGDFGYVCLVHSEMKGLIHVQSATTRLSENQTLVDAEGRVQAARLLGQGIVLQSQGLVSALLSGRDAVTAGIGKLLPGQATLAVLRFEPQTRVVHVGDTVTWTNRDPETPHTVTFGTEPSGGPFAAFAPVGIDRPSHATLTDLNHPINSGFLGAGLPFGTQFEVTFKTPGTYNYVCVLHDTLGMTGSITVIP